MSESVVQTDKLFWEIHSNLPREAPGDDQSTLRAFAMLKERVPLMPSILDIGCGPGPQTLALLYNTPARVIAVDNHQPFLDFLAQRVQGEMISVKVGMVNASMFNLKFDEQFDVLWSEGAIYIIGFEQGLRAWRPLLKAGGCVAVTELSWLKPNPPGEVAAFWQEAYPRMASVEENLERVRRAGYRMIGHFTLPESSWWDSYYDPMAARIEQLREKYHGNAEAQSILGMEYAEIELYRKYSDWYGYVFYVMQG